MTLSSRTSSLRPRVVSALAALIAILCFAGAAFASPRVLPPGQEEMFAVMLGRGAALPGECVWAGALIQGAGVTSWYDCGAAKTRVEVTLTDRPAAPPGGILTAQLSIRASSGAPPPGLLDALADRARGAEAKIKWIEIADEAPAPAGARGAIVDANRVPRLAWIALSLLVLLRLVSLPFTTRRDELARHAPDVAAFAVLTVLALAARLAVPWGPLDFAEPSRLTTFWSYSSGQHGTFESLQILMTLLRRAGLGMPAIFRFTGPVAGALGVGFTYLLARSAGLRRPAALLAGAILLVWPAHLRYSACGSLTVLGATLWTAAFAVALTPRLAPAWKLPLLAVLVVLGVYTRPEYRLLVVALLPLVFARPWTWRDRIVLLALLGVGLGPYALAHLAPHAEGMDATRWQRFFVWVLFDASVGPPWWIALGLAGFFVGRLPRAARICLILATGMLLLGYTRFGSEDNPLWGQWRYVVSVLPFFAIAAAALVDRVSPRGNAALALAGATLFSIVLHARVLRRPIDLQAEFAYVLDSAPRINRTYADLVLLAEEGAGGKFALNPEASPAMAIGVALGPAGYPARSASAAPPGTLRLWSQSAILEGDPKGPDPAKSAMFLGIERDPKLLSPLTDRFDLVPLEERDLRAVPATQAVNSQCAYREERLIGGPAEDCTMRVGWYLLVPRRRP